jgi:hypothetical protein
MYTLPQPHKTTQVASADTLPPKILSNEPHPSGVVRVTYSLPGLNRAIVTVPDHRWVQGGHSPVGRALAANLAALAAQDASIADSLAE